VTRSWTSDEIDTLRHCYAKHDKSTGALNAARKLLPHRTRVALGVQASTLGITTTHRRWTPEEDDVIRAAYTSDNRDPVGVALEALPHRTRDTIINRKSVIGGLPNMRKGKAFGRAFSGYKGQASGRGLSWALSYRQAEGLFRSNCFYCGSPPGNRNSYDIYLSSGIDRRDNTKGYTTRNSVPCCKTCNRAKNTMPYDEWIAWLDQVVAFRAARSPA
jgi:hypothetical protein